ncbi:MAG: ankyrin repeat domain-containing protein, partial [Nitrospiraceae bacterium]|nr:ankyrin repeat domain-containing protein [Nitrospiraceae bacterium]
MKRAGMMFFILFLAFAFVPRTWALNLNNELINEAGWEGYLKSVEVLIKQGADVNAKNNNGYTPLHRAAEFGHKDVAQTLIAHGADVNAKDNNGDTPLHEAAEGGQADIVKLLIAHGADINARDNAGRIPMQVANGKEIVALLQSAMLNRSGNKYDLLKKLLAQFKGHSDNDALRLSIIKLVKSLNPAPAVPREAQNLNGQAQYIFQHAQSEDDYMKAARKYLKAVEIAPWVPDYYYNLCVILDKTQFVKQSVHACRLYLDTTPDPSGGDASRIQTLVSGLEYAKKQAVKNLEGRTEYLHNTVVDELYRLGGISGNVMGHDVAIKLAVDWQAAPPRYQLLVSCIEGNQAYTWNKDIVTTDTGVNMCSSSTNMHLIIKPEGQGFVELADWSGNTYIRASLDQLFRLKNKALEKSPIYQAYGNDGKTLRDYVVYAQGG